MGGREDRGVPRGRDGGAHDPGEDDQRTQGQDEGVAGQRNGEPQGGEASDGTAILVGRGASEVPLVCDDHVRRHRERGARPTDGRGEQKGGEEAGSEIQGGPGGGQAPGTTEDVVSPLAGGPEQSHDADHPADPAAATLCDHHGRLAVRDRGHLGGIYPDGRGTIPHGMLLASGHEGHRRVPGSGVREERFARALEAWAILVALRKWRAKLKGQAVFIKSDSMLALAVLKKYASSSPTLNWVGGELALCMEKWQMPRLVPHHIAGKLNVEADWLSRPDQQLKIPVPERLQGLTVGSLTHEQVFDHELPPPGVNKHLWGASRELNAAFEHL